MELTEELVRKHFGKTVSIENTLLGGIRVTMKTGASFEIKGDNIRNIYGGKDVYEALTSLAKEAWGSFKTTGPEEHLLAMLAHAEVQDVPATVLIEEPGSGCMNFMLSVFTSIICAAIVGWFWGGKFAFMSGTIVAVSVGELLLRASKKAALRRGQRLHEIFPDNLGSGERDATREAAERMGMLE